jgi:hypothetical protein
VVKVLESPKHIYIFRNEIYIAKDLPDWQSNRNQIKKISNDEGELLLFQNMTGRCYHCNRFGHQANKCPVKNRKENGNNRSNSCFQGFQANAEVVDFGVI